MITLDLVQQAELARAFEHLVSPLDHPQVDCWREAVTRSVGALLGADIGTFVLSDTDSNLCHSPELPPDLINRYPELLEEPNARGASFEAQLRHQVWNRERVYRRWPRVYQSAYYNDYLVPNRFFDSIGITIRAGKSRATSPAGILFHHDREGGPTFGAQGLALLQVLAPAFKAGVDAYFRFFRVREELASVIDATGDAVLIVDRDGRELHRTPALVRLLTDEPRRDRILAMMQKSAGRMYGPRQDFSSSALLPDYRIRASVVFQMLGHDLPTALVTLERHSRPEAIAPRDLEQRFNLTRRQCDVARLLASGTSNREIANVLSISPHTARHHTEQVLVKLNVSSRAAAARIMADPQDS